MAVSYGPRRFNSLSAFLLLLLAAAGYWCWRFLPAYFDSWTVDHELREAAAETYRVARLPEPTRSQQLKLIAENARTKIISLGHVTDPDLLVNMDLEGEVVTLTADYNVVVTHPYINKSTTLHFHKSQSVNVKLVKWE